MAVNNLNGAGGEQVLDVLRTSNNDVPGMPLDAEAALMQAGMEAEHRGTLSRALGGVTLNGVGECQIPTPVTREHQRVLPCFDMGEPRNPMRRCLPYWGPEYYV